MNREIKFRAWDTTLFKMFEPRTLRDIAKEAPNNGVNWYQFEMMQYTGLKDKNGKEIYEGDIVNDMHDCEQLHQIIWNGAKACFERRNLKYDAMLKQYRQSPVSACVKTTSQGVVIGNIYENKELLDE